MIAFALLLAGTLAIAFGWATYFYVKDRYEKEPRHLLVMVFLAGAAATGPAWVLYAAIERVGFRAELVYMVDSPLTRLAYCCLAIGPIEELCKFLSVQLLIGRSREFDEPIDGIVYAALGGLGFASIENLVLAPYLDAPELWGRLLAAPLVHALFASIWGWGLALDRFGRPRRHGRVAGTLLFAMLMHGLYDFLVLSPSAMGRILGAGLILALWIGFFFVVARELKRSPHRRRASP